MLWEIYESSAKKIPLKLQLEWRIWEWHLFENRRPNDSRVLSSGPENSMLADSLLFVYATKNGTAFDIARLSPARWWMTGRSTRQERRGPTTRRHRLVKARNHHVGRRRDAAMHSTIMINSSNIAAASHLTAGQRRQVPLRQRGELNPRLSPPYTVDFRFIPCYPVRCCIVSRLWNPSNSISWGIYLMNIL